MFTTRPMHCRPKAYRLFSSALPKLGTTDGLVAAAVAIAGHELEVADPAAVNRGLQQLADKIRSRLRRPTYPTLLAHLHDVLFDEQGFAGAAQDYYNPLNSYLPSVLETKRGIPISLALVYKAVAERIGLRVRGINAPAHFLASVEVEGSWMLVDPFSGGRALTKAEAFDQIERSAGVAVPRTDELLRPATARQWLLRMLQNLEAIFSQTGRSNDLAAMQELRALVPE